MTHEEIRFWFAVGGGILAVGLFWGDLRRMVAHGSSISQERHQANVQRLERIEEKIDRINGTVREHGASLEDHEREILRLRDRERRRP